jgi:hypothetical protein
MKRIGSVTKQAGDLVGAVPADGLGHVRVGVEGDGDCRVPELLLHHLRVNAGFECERRHRVPGVVESDLRYAGALHGVFEHLGEAVRVVLDTRLVDE